MKILVDADACPVVRIVEKLASEEDIACVLVCDTSHELYSEYSEIAMVGTGADAVDYALINRCQRGDIVVTQDYGVAAMAIGKGALAIHQSGKYYTEDNIDEMLMQRHIGKCARRSNGKVHIKGPRKRSAKDDEIFYQAFSKLLKQAKFQAMLWEARDTEFQNFHSQLCPGKENILGIRVPVLKEMAKQETKICCEKIAKLQETAGKETKAEKEKEITIAVYEEYFQKYAFTYGEETMLLGYMISNMKADYETKLHFLPMFVKHIDSWAVCDSPVGSMKWIAKNKENFWKFMEHKYMHSTKEYELRFVIVVMLDYYIEPEYLEKVLHYYAQVSSDAYYVKMAIAWGISVCFVKFPEQTKTFLEKTEWDSFTLRKALSKIMDSYRVAEENKEWVRKFRAQLS